MAKPQKIESMEDLIKALSSGKSGVGVIGDGMTQEDRVRRTREIMEMRHSPENQHTFHPGQVVRHKFPKECTQKSANVPCVFVKYLGAPLLPRDFINSAQEVHSNAATAEMDCVIAVILDDGDGHYCEYLLDSRDFEPHPDFS